MKFIPNTRLISVNAGLSVLFILMLYFCGCEAHSWRFIMETQLKDSIKEGAQTITLKLGDQNIELVKIPAGSFLLGAGPDEQDHEDYEEPIRNILITKPFYIGRYEITQAQYFAVMGHEPLSYLEYHEITAGQYFSAQISGWEIKDMDYIPIRFEGDNLPVDEATFRVAEKFCLEISEQIGIQVTLPTSAQWEYACRAGTSTRFYTGDSEDDLSKAGWFNGNSNSRVHPVGQKEPNAFGLYDMHGNVYEYCLDNLPANYKIKDNAVDPIGRLGGSVRGGAWNNPAKSCRSASNYSADVPMSDMISGGGIRIVINPDSIE